MSQLERTLSEIAKPKWEGAPGFGRAWDECVRVARQLQLPKDWCGWAASTLRPLAEAHVLIVDGDQARALPVLEALRPGASQDFSLLQSAMVNVTLPWEVVYIEFAGGVRRADYDSESGVITGAVVGRGHGIDQVVSGCKPDSLWVQIFGMSTQGEMGMLGMICEAQEEPSPIVASPVLLLPDNELLRLVSHPLTAAEGITTVEQFRRRACIEAYDAGERALAVLQWLESVNVEIVDQPVTRQVRRNAERKRNRIAKIVRVKLPRSYRNGQPRNGAVEFSHRFEVRGHYKFFPEATRLAKAAPEKLSWVPERDGYFRRVWCPPFVKGPIDKPLVPKARLLVGPA